MTQNVRQSFTDFDYWKVVTRDWRVAYSREELRELGYKPHPRKYSARTGQGCYSKFYWTLKDAVKMPSKKGEQRRKEQRRNMAKDRLHVMRIHYNFWATDSLMRGHNANK